MIDRPTGRPHRVIGPVSMYVHHNDRLPYASGACAWIGDYCLAEYDGDAVGIADIEDPKRTVFRTERDGDKAVEIMEDMIEAGLGAVPE